MSLLKNKLKKVKKYLPFGSLNWYNQEGRRLDREKGKSEIEILAKTLGHSIYGLAGTYTIVVFGIHYTSGLINTGEFNYLKQQEILAERDEKQLLDKKRYSEAWDKLFVDPAYADRDSNEALTLEEISDAYKRMEFSELFIKEGKIEIDKPTLDQLERAVMSYEGERKW